MILEVNNTSDERRIYFLKAPDLDFTPKDINGTPGLAEREDFNKTTAIVSDIELQPSTKFVSKWAKDFHVSPFNSRKGFYALSARDPFYPYLSGKGSINNLVKLLSSKDHVKMVTRIFSTAESIDPSLLNLLGRFKFMASWWWVGLVTFPRIVQEAGKLFFRRKLHVWRRPEVLGGSIGRQETGDERYISDLVFPFQHIQAPSLTIFSPPHLQNSRMLFPSLLTLPSRTFKPHTPSQIHIHQLSSTARNHLPQHHQIHSYSFCRAHYVNNKHPSFLHSHRQHSQSSTVIPLPKPIHAHLTPNIPLRPLSFPTETSFFSATNNIPSPKASPKSSRQSRPCGRFTSTIWVHTVQNFAQRQDLLRPDECFWYYLLRSKDLGSVLIHIGYFGRVALPIRN